MKTYQSSFLLLVAIFVLGVSIFIDRHPDTALASVPMSNEYQATTSRSTSAAGLTGWSAVNGPAVVGSIVVNIPASAGYVQLWDATSTATSTYYSTDVASSSPTKTIGAPLIKIDSGSDVAGTYTYDINVRTGLVVETASGFNGEYTITYRQR
jgi:hypothetical protein